jgi:hypothetical protein
MVTEFSRMVTLSSHMVTTSSQIHTNDSQMDTATSYKQLILNEFIATNAIARRFLEGLKNFFSSLRDFKESDRPRPKPSLVP